MDSGVAKPTLRTAGRSPLRSVVVCIQPAKCSNSETDRNSRADYSMYLKRETCMSVGTGLIYREQYGCSELALYNACNEFNSSA